ncbi:J domain-containing protein [Methylobacterium nodulans]|nr:J domain-containing protein [Methylobacterium nodulans]
MSDAWTVLGLEPTSDIGAIRRAYARKVKAVRPDADPNGFQRLREARDSALRQASGLRQVEAPLAPEAMISTEPLTGIDEDGPEAAPHEGGPAVSIRINGFAELEAAAGHWEKAQELARRLGSIAGSSWEAVDAVAYSAVLQEASTLPQGPRQEVEAKVVELLGRKGQPETGPMSQDYFNRLCPLVVQAATVFDWCHDDSVIHAVLGPRHGAAFLTLIREALFASDPKRQWPGSESGPEVIEFLDERDARAFFEATPQYLSAYQSLRSRGEWPVWLDPFAGALPWLWALRRRRWITLLLILCALWIALGIAQLSDPGSRAYYVSPWFVILSVLLCLGLHLAVGLGADRIMMSAAVRASRAASRARLFDPVQREQFLREKGRPIGWGALAFLLYISVVLKFVPFILLFGPYVGIIAILQTLVRM